MFWNRRWDMKNVQLSGNLYLFKLCKGYRTFSTSSYLFCLLYIIIFKKELLIIESFVYNSYHLVNIGFGLRIGKPLTKLSSFFSFTVPMLNINFTPSIGAVGCFRGNFLFKKETSHLRHWDEIVCSEQTF